MKDIEYYMSLPYRMEIVPDAEEGGYTMWVPQLAGCATCGETVSEAMELIEDAKRSWFEACIEEGIEIPEPIEEKYSGQFKLRIPKSLHKHIVERAREEGVSMNAYCSAILAKYA